MDKEIASGEYFLKEEERKRKKREERKAKQVNDLRNNYILHLQLGQLPSALQVACRTVL